MDSEIAEILRVALEGVNNILKTLNGGGYVPPPEVAQPEPNYDLHPTRWFPSLEFDPSMQDPSLWPTPGEYKLSDMPREVATVDDVDGR